MNIIIKGLIVWVSTLISIQVLAASQSIYCPQNHAYINVGMSTEDVIAACGKPMSIQESKQPLFEKVPVQQLIYNNKGGDVITYATYSLTAGSNGAQLEIDLMDNKVKAVKVNGTNTNSASFCEGNSVQVGDEQAKVYSSCGAPSVINNTYINQAVQTLTKPQVWLYKPGQYQPAFTLTFVDGKLQSIQ